MRHIPRASKSKRTHLRRLKAAARREERTAPRLAFNETQRQWEIKGIS